MNIELDTVNGGDGELLTSTEDIGGQWKEYFEELLIPSSHILEGSRTAGL